MKRYFFVFFMILAVEYTNASDTPLHVAARNGSTKEVEKLLQQRADPHARNEAGCVPVQIAANHQIRLLLVEAMNEKSSAKLKE